VVVAQVVMEHTRAYALFGPSSTQNCCFDLEEMGCKPNEQNNAYLKFDRKNY
jgi:hypothetical protein